MFDSVRNYLYGHRQRFATLTGYAGACYLVGEYAYERLQDMREVVRQSQSSRENLRRRFHQNQFDISVTIVGFLPQLTDGVLKEMDIEGLLQELQVQTKAAKSRGRALRASSPDGGPSTATTTSHEPVPSTSSLGTSVEVVTWHDVSPASRNRTAHGPSQAPPQFITGEGPFSQDHDAHSDVISVSGTSANGTENSRDPDSPISIGLTMASSPSISSQAPSWVEGYESQLSIAGPSHELAMPTPSQHHSVDQASSTGSPRSNVGAYLSDSYMSDSHLSTAASVSTSDVELTRTAENAQLSIPQPRNVNSAQRKAEIWRELKILALTRALTVLYSTTLLTLFMHVQINIIGRFKYVHSIVQQCREEKLAELERDGISLASILFNYGFGFGIGGGPLSGLMSNVEEALSEEERMRRWVDEDLMDVPELSVEAEEKILGLNWWLLFVGWKDVMERVEKEVRAVFKGISLRAELTPMEFHGHICDIRRRIEHEVTYEGETRRVNFLSTLLPQTAETLNLCLQRGRTANVYTAPSLSSSLSASTLTSNLYDSQMSSSFAASPGVYTYPNPASDPTFADVFSEIRSHILSQTFESALTACLDRATEVLMDDLKGSGLFKESEGEERSAAKSDDGSAVDGNATSFGSGEGKAKLAKLVHWLGPWSKTVLEGNPNAFVDRITDVRDLSVLSAVIYSQFDNKFQ